MAATVSKVVQNNDSLRGSTERGLRASTWWKFTFTGSGTYYTDAVLDTIDAGFVAICFFIDNLTANGALTGVKFTPQVSIDGQNWTNVAWKDLTGTETASGETTIAQNTTQYVIINFSSYPEVASARFFRLKVDVSSNAASVFRIYGFMK